MNTRDEIISFIKENLSEFEEKYSISSIGLFGSIARCEEKAESDIDLVIEFSKPINIYETKQAIRYIFESRFNRKIDLCREKYIKPYVRDIIEKEIIYVKQ